MDTHSHTDTKAILKTEHAATCNDICLVLISVSPEADIIILVLGLTLQFCGDFIGSDVSTCLQLNISTITCSVIIGMCIA